ncbi:MAG: polymerase subunit epsilon [Geminicoccaceae bacterium]|nr:polymerase subunit epsilon [Geminicoccaceae bacterium]
MRAGRNWLRVLFLGDTDEMPEAQEAGTVGDEFDRPPGAVMKDMVGGGVSLPWNLAFCGLIGLSLLFTRITLGADGGLANSDHLIGSLVLAVTSLAAAEVARPLRFLNILLGAALFVTPFIYGASMVATAASLVCGAALVALSIRRGPIRERYGAWTRLIV